MHHYMLPSDSCVKVNLGVELVVWRSVDVLDVVKWVILHPIGNVVEAWRQ